MLHDLPGVIPPEFYFQFPFHPVFCFREDPEIIDGLGDVVVCLINIAALEDLDLTACLKSAYEQIKDRKGYMNKDGIFVKQT